MAEDVQMKDAAPAVAPEPDANELLVQDIKNNIALLEKAVATKEARFTARVLRQITSIRKKLNAAVLTQVINTTLSTDGAQKDLLLGYLSKIGGGVAAPSPMEITGTPAKEGRKDVYPEVEIYLQLLVTILLIDQKQYAVALDCSKKLVDKINKGHANRYGQGALAAKCFFYYSRAAELSNQLESIRPTLHAALRTATLRRNDEGQATILNLLLRNYLHFNLYDQADKLVSKTIFREDTTSSNQFARYLYYLGTIKATQLDYSEAFKCLQQAIRKGPAVAGRGFRIAAHKLLCIVQLLMGDIPDRSIFYVPSLKGPLKPYFQITQAVRVGDLAGFRDVVTQHAAVFQADKTFTLIQRLRQNVIKTGLRKINLSYSRISLADVTHKLHLDTVEDCEYIIAKAIRDGVIDAVIDHEGGFIQSKENPDIYSTNEPQNAFHKRISFCLNIHNEAVKAMRFPADAHKQEVESAEQRRERLQQEQELAKNLQEDDDDF